MLIYEGYENNTNKFNWKKVLVIVIVIAIIITGIFLGIHFGKKYAEKNGESENTNMPENTETPEIVKEIKQYKIPQATEQSRSNLRNLFSSDSEEKRVFLTFDDGPSANITPLILDLLKQNDIKATFFTLGSRVTRNPEIVKRAFEEGHYIANHGWSHNYDVIYASLSALLDEYNRTEVAIRQAIGVPEYSSHLFRFPGGSTGGKYNNVKAQYIKSFRDNEIMYVDWNCLNEDASGNRTKEQLVSFIKKYSYGKNSLVVLMHDASDKILTYETLQEVIDFYRENGYEFYNFYDIFDYELIDAKE